jgi:hypothetical protein
MVDLSTYRPRKGDVILVAATVRADYYPGAAGFTADVAGLYQTAYLKLDDVRGVRKLTFEVGDRVRGRGKVGKIVALVGDFAWVAPDDKDAPPITAEVAYLERLRDEALAVEGEVAAEQPAAAQAPQARAEEVQS